MRSNEAADGPRRIPTADSRAPTSMSISSSPVRWLLAFGYAVSFVGCAHGPSDEELARQRTERQEQEVLKERVRRLERRLSDLDAKMALLMERADGQGAATPPAAVSSGPAYPVRPPAGPAPAPEPALPEYDYTTRVPVAVGPGAHPVDLPRDDVPPVPVDPDPSEQLVVGDEPAGRPIVIDQAALARLTGGPDPQPSSREPYSREPNRPVTRRDTRPGPGGAPPASKATPPLTETVAHARPRGDVGAMPTHDAKKLYAWAMARREEGEWAQAVGAFDEVLKRFPKHHLADNAIYWMGVCHASRGAHPEALRAWRSLPMRYPESAKLPDALYGMAELHEAAGDVSAAIDLYAQLIDQYPKAERVPAARAAIARLRGR